MVALIDGREELPGEIAKAPEPLREYVAGQFNELSDHPVFDNGIEGALPSSPEAQARVELVIHPRIDDIIAAAPRDDRQSGD